MRPPIVSGLTETAQTASPSDLMATLATTTGRDAEPTTGMRLLRDAIEAMHRAAGVDPKLAQRIERALAVLEGTDDVSVRQRESGRETSRIGPLLGNARTPI